MGGTCEIIVGNKCYATPSEMSYVYENVEASLRGALTNEIVTRRNVAAGSAVLLRDRNKLVDSYRFMICFEDLVAG